MTKNTNNNEENKKAEEKTDMGSVEKASVDEEAVVSDKAEKASASDAEITVDDLIGKLAELQKKAESEKAKAEEMTDYAIAEITGILRQEHMLGPDEADDFDVRSQQELSEMLDTTMNLLTTLLACIAGISLIVGGIGIMNIMYV